MSRALLAFSPDVAEKVTAYCEEHSTPLPVNVEQHREFTRENFQDAYKVIKPLEAHLFLFLARYRRAKRILEIGCYTGYSALLWAHALKDVEEAEIITLDIDPKMNAVALSAFEKYGVSDRIKLMEGPAAETMQSICGEFDIIFIDAGVESHRRYIEIILERGLLSKTGIIITDDVAAGGLVVDMPESGPNQSQASNFYHDVSRYPNPPAMREFNDYVLNEPRLEVVVLPMCNGVGLIRLKD